MNEIRKLIVILFGLIIGIATSYLVMTKGWGVEVRSWWWVIGGSLFGHIMAQGLIALGTRSDKDPNEK